MSDGNYTPAEMAKGLMKKHGLGYATRMVAKMLDDCSIENRVNLPVGPIFYDEPEHKKFVLKRSMLDKTLNFWNATAQELKRLQPKVKEKKNG